MRLKWEEYWILRITYFNQSNYFNKIITYKIQIFNTSPQHQLQLSCLAVIVRQSEETCCSRQDWVYMCFISSIVWLMEQDGRDIYNLSLTIKSFLCVIA